MTQTERVLDYMRRAGSITTWEAVVDLGIASLSRRICDLHELGIATEKETVQTTNRFGAKTHYTKYSLLDRTAAPEQRKENPQPPVPPPVEAKRKECPVAPGEQIPLI